MDTNDDEGLNEAIGVRWEISDEIAEMPALTLAGYRAKAAVALVLLVENCRDEQSSADTDFALAALRDLAGSTVT